LFTENDVDGFTLVKLNDRMVEVLLETIKEQVRFHELLSDLKSTAQSTVKSTAQPVLICEGAPSVTESRVVNSEYAQF